MSLQKFIIILITFQLSSLYAQDGFESLGFQAQLSIQDFSNRKASKPVQLNISGSQYFDLDFKPARLSYFGKEINNAGFMRYNGFTDEIEITDSGNVENSELILLKSDKVVPIINNEIFEYLPFRINESNTKIGYLVKIYEGTRIKLYLRKNKQFMEAKIARTSLENSFPPRYVDNIETYISIEGECLTAYTCFKHTALSIVLAPSGVNSQYCSIVCELLSIQAYHHLLTALSSMITRLLNP